jgi:hypothetical protein
MTELPLFVDPQPIGGIVEIENAFALLRGPILKTLGERGASLC